MSSQDPLPSSEPVLILEMRAVMIDLKYTCLENIPFFSVSLDFVSQGTMKKRRQKAFMSQR